MKAPPFRANCPVATVPLPSAPPLIIDAHCHIFNGSDLPVKEFLDKALEKGAGGEGTVIASQLLQDLAWDLAPSGDEELKVLTRMVARKTPAGSITLEQHRDRAYKRARKAIQDALDSANKARVKPRTSQAPSQPPPPVATANAPAPPVASPQLQTLEAQIRQRIAAETLAGYRQAAPQPLPPPPPPPPGAAPEGCTTAAGAGREVGGMVDYVITNFHYRYAMIEDYLEAFTYTTGNCVDLIVAAMVDYDWWLTGGDRRATQTPLETQVQVMKQISILSRGQVHGLVPFDPFHEVAFRAGKSSSKKRPLQLVKDAILSDGCIGVKMYPPMGFAPLGNADLGNYWDDAGLPDWVYRDIPYPDGTSMSFGKRLDQALEALYGWCTDPANDVPIMAHSSMSNGVTDKLQQLAGADHWKCALAKFPSLRISFGHLGDFSDTLTAASPPDAQKFIDMLANAPNAYADSGYFSAILSEEGCVQNRLAGFYRNGGLPLAKRLMYGTDWNLLISQGNITDYYQDFVQAFQEIDKIAPQASQGFFGRNAAEWLGLAGGRTRTRLDQFYANNGVFAGDTGPKEPGWATKLNVRPVTG